MDTCFIINSGFRITLDSLFWIVHDHLFARSLQWNEKRLTSDVGLFITMTTRVLTHFMKQSLLKHSKIEKMDHPPYGSGFAPNWIVPNPKIPKKKCAEHDFWQQTKYFMRSKATFLRFLKSLKENVMAIGIRTWTSVLFIIHKEKN